MKTLTKLIEEQNREFAGFYHRQSCGSCGEVCSDPEYHVELITKVSNENTKHLLTHIIEEIEKSHVEPTDSDKGYETGVTLNGKRLSHNQKDGYNKALTDIQTMLKEVRDNIK